MDQIKTMLDRLSDLSDGEIAELEGLILSEFEGIEKDEPSPQTVDQMTALADALDSVRSETSRRSEQQAELAKRASEAASRIKGEASAQPETESGMMPEDEDEEEEVPVAPVPDVPAEAPAEEPVPDVPAEPEADEEEDEEPELASESTETAADAVPAQEASDEAVVASADEEQDEAVTASGSDDTPTTPQDEQPQEDAVTASGNEPQEGVVVTPPADHLPTPTKPQATVTITAGADIPGFGAGATLTDMNEVSVAFAKRLHTLRNVTASGIGEQHTVATLSFDYPEDRRLSGDDASNFAKINDVISPEAITAAAGVCAPLTTVYDVKVFGITDRPVRDALARFNADRGGVRVYPTPVLPSEAVGIWDTSGAATKTCGDAACSAPQEVMLDAVYACLKFSNFTNRFFPEMVKANTDLSMIHHAKAAEVNLLKGIQAGSTKVTADLSGGAGAARALLTTVDRAITAQRRRHRLAHTETLRVIIPSFAFDIMRADLALQAPGDGIEQLAAADAMLERFFNARNVNVTKSIETINASGTGVDAAAQAAGALNAFPTEVNFAVYPEGTFLFLDGGTLDLGIVRDGTMVAANEYSTFVETFEAVVKVGVESLWVTASGLCVSGAASDLVDLSCSTPAS